MKSETMRRLAYANDANLFPADTAYYCLDSRWELEREFRTLKKRRRVIGHKNTRGKLDCFLVFDSVVRAYWYACKTTSAKGFSELCRIAKPDLKPPYYECKMQVAA